MGQPLSTTVPDLPGLIAKGKMPNGEMVVVEDVASAWCHVVHSTLSEYSQHEVSQEKPFTLALSGGPTARKCYETLADTLSSPPSPHSPLSPALPSSSPAKYPFSHPFSLFNDISWNNVHILVGDERCVPIDHPDSNSGMIKEVLISNIHDIGAFYPMDCKAGPSTYSDIVSRYIPLDLVHLGMGIDGHSASLFPGSTLLDEQSSLVAYSRDPQQMNAHDRMTLLLPAINSSRQVIFTVSGSEKLEAMAKAMQGIDMPALHINAGNVLWIVDEAANPR